VAIRRISKKSASNKNASERQSSTVCFNKECKLRKQKSCRGFEGCPGFKGK
jgi:hypothetical protein